MFGKKKKKKEEVVNESVNTALIEPQNDSVDASEFTDSIAGIDEVADDSSDFENTDYQQVDLGNDIFGDLHVDSESGEEVLDVDEEVFDSVADSDGYYTIPATETTEEKKVKVKKRKPKRKKKERNFMIGVMTDENYGPLLPYIQDINVTDINWNGMDLWIDDVTLGRYKAETKLSPEFVSAFSIRVANVVSKQFNKYSPRLEAETKELRITIVHDSVNNGRKAISIRKTPAIKRITFAESVMAGKYCDIEICNFLSNSVKARKNIVICGLTGVGKTELVKFLTNYIFPSDRAITIEDTYELHYAEINPGKDCMELKVNETNFTYTDAIKACMRLLPRWILLSEARSIEVKYLIETMSTGAKCITTLHTDDVRKIPDRVLNMIGDIDNQDNIINSVYNFFDIGVLIDKRVNPETHKIERWISQVCYFDRANGENKCYLLADKGKVLGTELPDAIVDSYKFQQIPDPWKYTYIEN